MDTGLYNTLKTEKEASINTAYDQIKKYEVSFNLIYTPKLAKRITSNSARILKYVALTISIMVLSVMILVIAESIHSGDYSTRNVKTSSVQVTSEGAWWGSVLFLSFTILCFLVSLLFHKLIHRNKTISQLAVQMLDVINTEKKHLESEKQSYFNLLDTMQRDMNKPEGK